MSISTGLDIAAGAPLVQEPGVDTVSHNIANVNTEGDSRQRLHREAGRADSLSLMEFLR